MKGQQLTLIGPDDDGHHEQEHPAPTPLVPAEAAARGEETAAETRLSRLGVGTSRRRNKKDRKLAKAEKKGRDAIDQHAADLAGEAAALEDQAQAKGEATGNDRGHPDDRTRRSLGTVAYVLLLIMLGCISVPVAYVTLQVLEEPLSLTLLLALLVDVVFLTVAHGAGVTLKRTQLVVDPRLSMFIEWVGGWALFGLGMLFAGAQALVRWRYLAETGDGTWTGIVFSTVLAVMTFLVAVWAAFSHYNAPVAALAKTTRALRRAKRAVARSLRRLNRARRLLRNAFNARRELAVSTVSEADRIIAHHTRAGLAKGYHITVPDPAWLRRERDLAHAEPGIVQPFDADPDDQMPGLAKAD